MTQTIRQDATVSFEAGNFYVQTSPANTGTIGSITTTTLSPHAEWVEPYRYWYPNYHSIAPNKFEQAFKVATVLQEKKLINIRTIKQFIELIDELQKVL